MPDIFSSAWYVLRKLWHRFKPLKMFCNRCQKCDGSSFERVYHDCSGCVQQNRCPSCGYTLSPVDYEWLMSDSDVCPFCRYSPRHFDPFDASTLSDPLDTGCADDGPVRLGLVSPLPGDPGHEFPEHLG